MQGLLVFPCKGDNGLSPNSSLKGDNGLLSFMQVGDVGVLYLTNHYA